MSESRLDSDRSLRELVTAIVVGDAPAVDQMLAASPVLHSAFFGAGATRENAKSFFIHAVLRYSVAGDTALHFAAAAYQPEIANKLLAAGADVRARNRFGDEPLHAAAAGFPGTHHWKPVDQAATISCLIQAGADPNAASKRGVTPLHIAVRTRASVAVRTLLGLGADPTRKNKNGSTPMLLATLNTGRGGTGSPKAKNEQLEIQLLLRQATQPR